ncbi:MAG: monovalent cation/H(+) antiporter subunit G [Acidiferrobacterales bacterium]
MTIALIDLLSWTFLVAGGFFGVVGGIGIVRFPDLFTRFHAAGMTDTLAAGLILIGLMLQAGWSLVTVKLLLILVFGLFTSPTATHALAKAALHGRVKPRLSRKGS